MLRKIIVLSLLFSHLSSSHEQQGFLQEFFAKFPHLLHPQSEAYYRALSKILSRRKSGGSNFQDLIQKSTVSTTTSTITTSLPAIKRSITTLPKVKVNQNNEDIWFGSTPAPMYRGYVTNSYKFRSAKKPPSLKFHASDPSPPTLKFIEPHRLVGSTKPLKTTVKPTLQPLYYSSTKNLKKPYEIIKEELTEPSYMTDPNFSLMGNQKEVAKIKLQSPYDNTKSMVKPQEVKSLKPKIPEIQPLETTTEVYDYSYLYENYPDYQDYQDYDYHHHHNYLDHPDPSDVSSLPPRPPVKQISTEPTIQGTKTEKKSKCFCRSSESKSGVLALEKVPKITY